MSSFFVSSRSFERLRASEISRRASSLDDADTIENFAFFVVLYKTENDRRTSRNRRLRENIAFYLEKLQIRYFDLRGKDIYDIVLPNGQQAFTPRTARDLLRSPSSSSSSSSSCSCSCSSSSSSSSSSSCRSSICSSSSSSSSPSSSSSSSDRRRRRRRNNNVIFTDNIVINTLAAPVTNPPVTNPLVVNGSRKSRKGASQSRKVKRSEQKAIETIQKIVDSKSDDE